MMPFRMGRGLEGRDSSMSLSEPSSSGTSKSESSSFTAKHCFECHRMKWMCETIKRGQVYVMTDLLSVYVSDSQELFTRFLSSSLSLCCVILREFSASCRENKVWTQREHTVRGHVSDDDEPSYICMKAHSGNHDGEGIISRMNGSIVYT